MALLERVEGDLGTEREMPRDLKLSQHIGHELKNRWLADLMRSQIEE